MCIELKKGKLYPAPAAKAFVKRLCRRGLSHSGPTRVQRTLFSLLFAYYFPIFAPVFCLIYHKLTLFIAQYANIVARLAIYFPQEENSYQTPIFALKNLVFKGSILYNFYNEKYQNC